MTRRDGSRAFKENGGAVRWRARGRSFSSAIDSAFVCFFHSCQLYSGTSVNYAAAVLSSCRENSTRLTTATPPTYHVLRHDHITACKCTSPAYHYWTRTSYCTILVLPSAYIHRFGSLHPLQHTWILKASLLQGGLSALIPSVYHIGAYFGSRYYLVDPAICDERLDIRDLGQD